MARELMDEHGLDTWTFAFLEAERRLGDCHFGDRVIRVGRAHALDASEAEIRDTVLHEIAHALAGPEARHGPAWKAIARRIGATPPRQRLRTPGAVRVGWPLSSYAVIRTCNPNARAISFKAARTRLPLRGSSSAQASR